MSEAATVSWVQRNVGLAIEGARALPSMMMAFGARRWLLAGALSIVAIFVLGIPTAVIPNPVFGRSVDVRDTDYVVLAISAGLLGILVASYVGAQGVHGERKLPWAGGFLSFVAVGCPTCNKAAVLLLGTSGALSVFGPLQIALGFLSVGLLVVALVVRARAFAVAECPLPTLEPAT